MDPITTPPHIGAGMVPSWDLLQIRRSAIRHDWQFEDNSAALRWTEVHRPNDAMIKVWHWMGDIKRGKKAMTGIYIPDTWEEEQELTRPSRPHTSPEVGKVRSVAELREDRQPTIWTVDQFGARGNAVILAPETGLGKTSFMYRAAEAVALGLPLMGQLPTAKGRVLFLQADESRRNAANKLEAMDMEAEGIEFLFPDEQGWNGHEMDRLKAHMAQGYEAVFLDSISTLLTHGPHSMKDAEFRVLSMNETPWPAGTTVL
jgi:hypothetical protein